MMKTMTKHQVETKWNFKKFRFEVFFFSVCSRDTHRIWRPTERRVDFTFMFDVSAHTHSTQHTQSQSNYGSCHCVDSLPAVLPSKNYILNIALRSTQLRRMPECSSRASTNRRRKKNFPSESELWILFRHSQLSVSHTFIFFPSFSRTRSDEIN